MTGTLYSSKQLERACGSVKIYTPFTPYTPTTLWNALKSLRHLKHPLLHLGAEMSLFDLDDVIQGQISWRNCYAMILFFFFVKAPVGASFVYVWHHPGQFEVNGRVSGVCCSNRSLVLQNLWKSHHLIAVFTEKSISDARCRLILLNKMHRSVCHFKSETNTSQWPY